MKTTIFSILLFLCGKNGQGCTNEKSEASETSKSNHSVPDVPDVKCGIANSGSIGKRIIGGHIVEPLNKYPWIVSIYKGLRLMSSGTIMSNTFILTRGQLFVEELIKYNRSDFQYDQYCVYAGMFDQSKKDKAQRRCVTSIIIHDKFFIHEIIVNNKPTNVYVNDLALLKLVCPLKFNRDVRPICLPASNEWVDYQGEATVAGWGMNHTMNDPDLYLDDEPSRFLQEVTLPFIPNPDCYFITEFQDEDGDPINATLDLNTVPMYNETMICSGYLRLDPNAMNKTTSYYDAGSPLVIQDEDGMYTQIGVATFSNYRPVENLVGPSVFVRITSALDWIKKNI